MDFGDVLGLTFYIGLLLIAIAFGYHAYETEWITMGIFATGIGFVFVAMIGWILS